MSCIKRYSLILLFVTMAVSSAHGGTLVGTGGDPWTFLQLELQRDIYIRTLERIQADHSMSQLKTEAKLADFCKSSGLYQPAEQKTCVDYILSTSFDIIACTYGSNKPDFRVIRPTEPWEIELFEAVYPGNKRQSVPAATFLSNCHKPLEDYRQKYIYFHYDRIRDWTGREAFLAVAHEMGHKIDYHDEPIKDDTIFGTIAGYQLLNSAAFAVYAYSNPHNLSGVQIVTEEERKKQVLYEDKRHFFNCEFASDSTKVAFRFSTQVTERANGTHFSRNNIGSPGYEISDFTRPLFPDDRFYLSVTIQAADTCAAPSSNVNYSTLALLLKNPPVRDADPVASASQILGSINCLQNPAPIILRYQSMVIECKYDGFHAL